MRELSGRLGYYAFVPHAGKGLMREGSASSSSARFASSACIGSKRTFSPAIAARSRSSRGLGFRREGKARGFLKIGNRWRDHERWALLKEDWRSR